MRSRFLLTVAICACGASAALGQGSGQEPLEIGRRVAARYDSAIAVLVERARPDSAEYGWLLELARFKDQHVGWAVESRGELRAVRSGRWSAWFAVVPENDPAYGRMGSVMETDLDATVRATRVKADTIAAPWAAIFMAFELSLLRDDVLELLPEQPTTAELDASSRRAYEAEYSAVRLAAGPDLEAHLDATLAALVPPSLTALAEGLMPTLQESFAEFDARVTSQGPLTNREEQRRVGVYAVALLLRHAERTGATDDAFGAALRCIGGCR